MDEKKLQDILGKGPKIKLQKSQKDAVRQNLMKFMQENPVKEVAKESAAQDSTSFWQSFVQTFQLKNFGQYLLKPASGALIVLMTLTSVTSYAAEGALPGDLLYTFKTEINENVIGAFKFGPEAEADWSIKRVERRLEEATELALEGELNVEAQEIISTKVQDYVEEMDQITAGLQTGTAQEMQKAKTLNTKLISKLETQKEIITSIDDSSDNQKISTLIATIDSNLTTTTQIKLDLEESITVAIKDSSTESPKDDEPNPDQDQFIAFKVLAEEEKEKAERSISKIVKALSKDEGRINQAALSSIKAKVHVAQEFFAEGQAKIKSNDHLLAYLKFSSAYSSAVEALDSLSANIFVSGEIDQSTEPTDPEEDPAVTTTRPSTNYGPSTTNDDTKKQEAEAALAAAQSMVAKAKSSLKPYLNKFNQTTIISIESRIESAENLIAKGQGQYNVGLYISAKAFYEDAKGLAAEAISIINQKLEIKVNVNTSSGSNDDDDDDDRGSSSGSSSSSSSSSSNNTVTTPDTNTDTNTIIDSNIYVTPTDNTPTIDPAPDTTPTDNTDSQKAEAQAARTKASAAITTATNLLNQNQNSIAKDSTLSAKAKIEDANSSFQSGDIKLKAENYSTAIAFYKQAESQANQAASIIRSAPSITPDPVPNPGPSPDPDPTPDPEPTPTPDPTPRPSPNPDPTPDPDPEPTGTPGPSPNPDPTPDTDPEPTQPGPSPDPSSDDNDPIYIIPDINFDYILLPQDDDEGPGGFGY